MGRLQHLPEAGIVDNSIHQYFCWSVFADHIVARMDPHVARRVHEDIREAMRALL
jgi:hypothetical protein